jgi:hypothetical protein
MRRVLQAALICLSMAFPALAQRGGHGGGGHAGGTHTGGVHAGGGHGASFGHGGNSGAFRGGFAHRPSFRSGFGFQRFPRIYPAFYGGFGYYDPYWNSPYSYQDSGYSSDYGYPAAQAPPVIVNQEFQIEAPPQPLVREYAPSAPPAPVQRQYEEPLYLIAFNDGVIRAVLAYWVEGGSLHYVTMDHAQKQVALASIDRALSERLNGERNVTFQLPR